MTRRTSLSTRAVHAGRDDLVDLGVHAVPLDLSTSYPPRDSSAEAVRLSELAAGGPPTDRPIYGRIGNPTVARFEAAMAELEGCAAAVAFSSGMAAMSACLLAAVAGGKRHVVAIRPLYGTSDHLLAAGLVGTEVTWVGPQEVAAALRPDTGLVIVESPANPTLREYGIRDLAAACSPVPLLVDNTFATPVLQRPVEHGARIVLHSATKFLGGHGDVMGGVVTCDEPFARSLRQVRIATGGVLHPLAGYLLLRGLATLPIRVRRAAATAAALAEHLAGDPRVSRVHYPGRVAHRPCQMVTGGALLAFEVVGDPHTVVRRVRLITPAVSLGSVETLIQHPASLTHQVVAPADRLAAGISDQLLRLSVGLEDLDDLWADLNQALPRHIPATPPEGDAQMATEKTSRCAGGRLIDALHVAAPAGDHAEKLELFGRFVGSWQLQWTGTDPDGLPLEMTGELHFGWVLGGRAVQDIWIVPSRTETDASHSPVGFHGSTIRFYDPTIDGWRSTWIEPLNARVRRFVGRAVGHDIVLVSDEDDPQLRWSFTKITPSSFQWTGEVSADGGATWRLEEQMHATRTSL